MTFNFQKSQTFPLELNFKLEVSSEDIDQIVNLAFIEGITYWLKELHVEHGFYGGNPFNQISRGNVIWMYYLDSDKNYCCAQLDREKFLAGLKKYFETEKPNFMCKESSLICMSTNPDAADKIIQYAVFGDILFKREDGKEEGENDE